MSYYDEFSEYVPVAVKKKRAQEAQDRLRQEHPNIEPVVIRGRKIAKTWWGKAWIDNLERYADYANRMDRGRSYVRHGSVLDLKMKSGIVTARVQGSEYRPYQVDIVIKPLTRETWEALKASCVGKIDSLSELMKGAFPEALSELFTARGSGLFPSPKEISLQCSCPDYASMCKHAAAVLYGIGARLDDNASLFFTLREVNVDELVSEAISDQSKQMLKKSARKSRRVLKESDLSATFGIDMDGEK